MQKRTILGILFILSMLLSFAPANSGTESNVEGINYTVASPFGHAEILTVYAEYGEACLVDMGLYGGNLDIPLTGVDTELSKAKTFALMVNDMGDYATYMDRRPLPLPDGLILVLEFGLGSNTEATAWADAILAAINAEWELTMTYLTIFHYSGFYHKFIARGVLPDDADLEGFTDDNILPDATGFGSWVSPAHVLAAPVYSVGLGFFTLGDLQLSFRKVSYVEPNGLNIGVADELGIELSNLFPSITTFGPISGSVASYIRYRIPYEMHATYVDPAPSNPVPDLSGKWDWIIASPWYWGNLLAVSDIALHWDINTSLYNAYPMVYGEITYDKTLLDTQGELLVTAEFTNDGDAPATNVHVRLPMGIFDPRDYKGWFPALKDDITVNAKVSTIDLVFSYAIPYPPYSVEVTMPVANIINWYYNTTSMSFARWSSLTSLSLGSNIELSMSGGCPQDILDWVTANLDDSIIDDLIANPELALQCLVYTTQQILGSLYDNVSLLAFDPMDFTVVEESMGSWYGEPLNFYYLDYVIPSLAPAASDSAQFKVTGIPASCHRFGAIRADLADFGGIAEMDTYSNFTMLEFTAAETLQYISAMINWDARPFSWATGYYTGEIIHMNFGLMFQYEDEAGIDFFGMTSSSNMQLWDDEAVLSTVVTIPDAARGDYDITIGEEITISANVTNYGDCDATDVKLYFVHGLIGYNWQLEYIELFHEATIGTVAAGTSVVYDFDVNATTYLGLHAVIALVEYKTDPGQGALEVENPFTGNTLDWTWAGEELIMGHSSMMLGLLRPPTPAEEPAFPQPVLDIDDSVESLGAGDYIKTVTITNVGDADTSIMAVQYFPSTTIVEVTGVYTTIGNDFHMIYAENGYQIAGAENIYLAPGESVTITIEFHAYSFTFVPPIGVIYDSDYQNEFREEGLGSELFIYGHEMGDFKAQERDVTGTSSEENSWSDYSTTTSSVGAAATDDDGSGSDDGRTSFLGEAYGYLLAASAMITAVVIIRRRK